MKTDIVFLQGVLCASCTGRPNNGALKWGSCNMSLKKCPCVTRTLSSYPVPTFTQRTLTRSTLYGNIPFNYITVSNTGWRNTAPFEGSACSGVRAQETVVVSVSCPTG
jgi:hypothetical protein